jgi:hypothetical protein
MRRTEGPAAAAAEGVRIAQELVTTLAPMIAGVQVYSPSGRLGLAVGVLEAVGQP